MRFIKDGVRRSQEGGSGLRRDLYREIFDEVATKDLLPLCRPVDSSEAAAATVMDGWRQQ